MKASDIASFLGKKLIGRDITISLVKSINNLEDGCITFCKKYDSEIEKMTIGREVLLLVTKEFQGKLHCPHIICENPRADFARTVDKFFITLTVPSIAASAVIEGTAKIGKSVNIGEYSVIEAGVEIGDNTFIDHHVVIKEGVKIGKSCLIKPHVVIGEAGFGFERDEKGTPIHVPQIGSVRIGNNVWMGTMTTVDRGTLEDTVICDDSKISTKVHISHNVYIGGKCIIAGNVQINGSAVIEDEVWLSPQCNIMNKITVGKRAFIGLGAVVLNTVEPGAVMVGNPARRLR